MMGRKFVAAATALAAIAVTFTYVLAAEPEPAPPAGADAPVAMTRPAYNDGGELLLPEGYREWIFVGASLGLSYNENMGQHVEGPGDFHHVYIQPEAYRQYRDTGTFPEKTMLVMENYTAGQRVRPNLRGHFQDKRTGMEIAVKDAEHAEEGWSYYVFSKRDGLKESAKAFPKVACFDCHDQHAADDNVFVQFYPTLKEIMQEQGRWPGKLTEEDFKDEE